MRKKPVDVERLKKTIQENNNLTLKQLGEVLGGYAESTISKVIKKHNVPYNVKDSQSCIVTDYDKKINEGIHLLKKLKRKFKKGENYDKKFN